MQIFITATGTDIGKTLVSSWLCLHSEYDYFKPIQTGSTTKTDSETIAELTHSKIYPPILNYLAPVSPHLAAKLENEVIDIHKIALPKSSHLIVEGVGGLMVPINQDSLLIDLIKQFDLPVILVASSNLGTINHTLLSLAVLRERNIEILGVIISGALNQPNCEAIEFYGKVKILAQLEFISKISRKSLSQIPLTPELKNLLKV